MLHVSEEACGRVHDYLHSSFQANTFEDRGVYGFDGFNYAKLYDAAEQVTLHLIVSNLCLQKKHTGVMYVAEVMKCDTSLKELLKEVAKQMPKDVVLQVNITSFL